MKLKIGDKFRNDNARIQFEILDLEEDRDWCRVLCTNEDGYTWEEEWDDFHYVYSALKIGEYSMIQ